MTGCKTGNTLHKSLGKGRNLPWDLRETCTLHWGPSLGLDDHTFRAPWSHGFTLHVTNKQPFMRHQGYLFFYFCFFYITYTTKNGMSCHCINCIRYIVHAIMIIWKQQQSTEPMTLFNSCILQNYFSRGVLVWNGSGSDGSPSVLPMGRMDPPLFHPPWVRWIPQSWNGSNSYFVWWQQFWCQQLIALFTQTTPTLTIVIKAYLQITLINENHSFLLEQLAENNMKTNDSDNESFLSDQSFCFTLLGSDRSPRLKWYPWLFCLITTILMPEIDFELLCP